MIEFLSFPAPLHFTGKATLILINTWGFPIARLIKVKQVDFSNQSVMIRYSLKNERGKPQKTERSGTGVDGNSNRLGEN